jgi:Rrf2 family transcriptional regulator, iron-sulfur cluster assembly transcription factor
MTPYGKVAQHAIAAMSRLAQVYGRKMKLSSADIAQSRNLPQPVVAKVLTVLSQAGLVTGSPGPGGGYALAKPPGAITLHDVAELFDRQDEALGCPFGPGWCGNGAPCPLHQQLDQIRQQIDRFLKSNTFASFLDWPSVGPVPIPGDPPAAAAPKAAAGGAIALTTVSPGGPKRDGKGRP